MTSLVLKARLLPNGKEPYAATFTDAKTGATEIQAGGYGDPKYLKSSSNSDKMILRRRACVILSDFLQKLKTELNEAELNIFAFLAQQLPDQSLDPYFYDAFVRENPDSFSTVSEALEHLAAFLESEMVDRFEFPVGKSISSNLRDMAVSGIVESKSPAYAALLQDLRGADV